MSSKFFLAIAGLFVATAVLAQAPAQSDISPLLTPLAEELNCTSRATCEVAFDTDFKRGFELAEKYDVFANDPERLRLAETFKTEVLTKLTAATGADFEEKIIKLAQDIVRHKPTLARRLDVDRDEVEAAQTIVIEKTQFSEAMTRLQEALERGEWQELGAKNTDDLGFICLRPDSPKQCDDIAERFFGPEGVKTLTQARAQVTAVNDRYVKGVENFILTVPDGRTLTGKDEIRRACDQAFSSRNLVLARACGDLAIKNGFSSPREVEKGLEFLESIQRTVNLDECQRQPQACEQFIPEAERSEFKVMRQIHDIMTTEIGFPPELCKEGSVDLDISNRCLDGSKRALLKLESLAGQSPAAQRIIIDIKAHIAQGEKFSSKQQEFQTVFRAQGGPGGCKSAQECFAYCSDPSHGPECLAFGTKHQVFSGQGPYPGFQPSGFSTTTSPGHTPGFTEPGPGFSPPPGFGPGSGTSGFNSSPECSIAIQAGDFMKAKEVCQGQNFPGGSRDQSSNERHLCPTLPTVVECREGEEKVVSFSLPECGTYYRCLPTKGTPPASPPSPTTTYQSACPSGQYWNGTSCVSSTSGNYTSPPSGGGYGSDPATVCAQSGGTWNGSSCQFPSSGNYYPPPSGNYVPPPSGGFSTDPATGCTQAGGTWTGSTCQMPGTSARSPTQLLAQVAVVLDQLLKSLQRLLAQ